MPKTGQCRARACNAEDWAPMPSRGLQCRAGARNAEAATVGSGQICHRQASQCHVPQRHMCAKLTHPVSRILEKCREIGTKYVHKMLHVWPKLTQMISSHIMLTGNLCQSGKFSSHGIQWDRKIESLSKDYWFFGSGFASFCHPLLMCRKPALLVQSHSAQRNNMLFAKRKHSFYYTQIMSILQLWWNLCCCFAGYEIRSNAGRLPGFMTSQPIFVVQSWTAVLTSSADVEANDLQLAVA